MDEYKSNSNSLKNEHLNQQEKKVEQIVSGLVRCKKKSGIDKLAGVFISEDVGNVKTYIIKDVIIPAIKDVLEDIVVNGMRIILRGGDGQSKKFGNSSKISYRNFYNKENDRRDRDVVRSHNNYNYDDIILESRGEAESVLSSMEDLVSRYGLVSVADLYDLVGVTCNYTDNKYGWTDIRNSNVIRIRDGYLLKLSKPIPLD